MIKIDREACPPSLNKDDNKFHENDYAKDDVRDALMRMQHRKCCYCEDKLKELGPKVVEGEHYIPRSAVEFEDQHGKTQWHLANRWTNILYSCRNCNGSKLQTHPYNESTRAQLLIDPSAEDIDPEEHIGFILEKEYKAHDMRGKTPLGKTTCTILKFDSRLDLVGKFNKISLEIDKTFVDLKNAIMYDETVEIESKKKELSRLMSADCKFAGFCRAYIKMKLDKFNENGIPFISGRIKKPLDAIGIHFPSGAEIVNS